MSTSNYTLKVNIRAQEERERRERDKEVRKSLVKVDSTGLVARPRKRRGLQFNEPGKYIIEAGRLRKKAKLEELQKRIAASAIKTGISDAVKLASLTNKTDTTKASLTSAVNLEVDEYVPDIEWWDKSLIKNRTLEEAILRLDQNVNLDDIFSGITNLIERPPKKKHSGVEPIPMPTYLTKAERKKLRRQNRRDAELEKQEKIKLGLLPKPEPKLKRSTIMFTLGEKAIVEPSMADQLAKEQEEKRQQAHIEHNAAKKLSSEERKEKERCKIRKDEAAEGTWVSVYRIGNLSCPSHKFKVIKNAKQLLMTGILLLFKDFNVVVVEGGRKQQRKYKHLMLDRIKWDEDPRAVSSTEKSEINILKDNKCTLLWEGQTPNKSFRVFKVKTLQSVQEAHSLFKKFNIEHYWDLAYKMNILETISE